MIKSIKIANFCSIGEAQEISFEISPKDVLDDSAVEISNHHINLVNCFIGHNASGKTTVLKAIAFLFWLISDSYTSMKADALIPVDAHKFFSDKFTEIEMEFFNQGHLFQYKVELNRQYIKKEFLGKNITRGYTRIFEYARLENDWDFKSPQITINKNDLSRFKERKNVSVLSSLLETGYLPELAFIKKCKANITNMGPRIQHPLMMFFDISNSLHGNDDLQKEALSFIKEIDVGISDFDFFEAVRFKDKKADESEKRPVLECVHESDRGKFKLPLIEESSGTQHSLQLLSVISPILKTGGVVVLDEIESGLHPYVAKKIISLFESSETNPCHAQLIFSTHQHLLLNDRTKTQIFIVEKGKNSFESEVFRLDEVEGVRNDDNFFNKYLAGTYGGIPKIKWMSD